MDLATLIGILGALALIVLTMMMSGDITMFVNAPSLVIVLGGTFTAVMAKYSLSQYLAFTKIAGKGFKGSSADIPELIDEIVALADEARKGGLLSLEGKEVSSDFLQKGIQLLVDGHDPDVVKALLGKERTEAEKRHKIGASIFTNMASMAPAMGMIGTLVGLVAMLANMSDPKAIGPAMAVALLTTLYGAILANGFCEPLADKLTSKAADDVLLKNLVIDALLAIQNGQNPRVIDSMLRNYLPEGKREADAEG
ncbi:MAG: flagellar motor protein PomA [Pseudomonadota bacterium]